jgi:hypothetical protein
VSIAAFGGALLLALAFLGGIRDVGAAAAARARAQAAADAAALAAAAESLPGFRGAPTAMARRFAQANGAVLLACVCEHGATAMQVEVEVDGVEARARAAVDPTRVLPDPTGDLHPVLRGAVDRLLTAAGGRVWLTSGYRSPEHQQRLWQQALVRYGDPETADDWVARPGDSMHEKGLAVDLGGDVEHAVHLIDAMNLPLWRPMSWEPWHFELAGSRG